jgi:hypothetical protein
VDHDVYYGGTGPDSNVVLEGDTRAFTYDYNLYVTCGGNRYKEDLPYKADTVVGSTAPYDYVFKNLVPGEADIMCGLGQDYKMNLTIFDSFNNIVATDTGTLDVESKMSNPNKGHYIVSRFGVRTDPNKPSKARDFFLTNEPWYDDDNSNFNEFPDRDSGRPVEKGAFFLISEADGNLNDNSDEGIYISSYGSIIKPFSSSLGDYVLGRYTTSRGGPPEGWYAGGPPEHISQSLNREFAGSYLKQYGTEPIIGSNVQGGCHVASGSPAYEWRGNCAPLHNNGVYEPQGELIVASEPSATFADPGDVPLSISPKTHFYVCRNHPTDSNWQGTQPSNSKVVKVQQKEPAGNLVDEWKYYRCNTLNDWEEVECEPGQEVADEGSGLECVNKDPVTVEVQFFNMSSVPRPSGAAGDTIKAGFKIESSEIQKYEDLMGEALKRIDAECWMGDDDQRPSSESASGTFRLNYDQIGSGDAWVLGKIPYRNGVNNQTYSCVWGFSEEAEYSTGGIGSVLLNEGIYESTRNRPLRSVEGSRINVNYTKTIQPEYINLAKPTELDERVDRADLWTPYSSEDTRSYIDSTEEDMFDAPFDETPYCEQPPYSTGALQKVYDEIICTP